MASLYLGKPRVSACFCLLLVGEDSEGKTVLTYSMQHYEVLFILPGTVAENEVAPVVAKVKETIEQSGGQEIILSDLGKSRLAYPMNHIRYGYFQVGRFMAEPRTLPEMQEKLRLMSQLLRVMITIVDPKKSMSTRIDVITDVRDPKGPVPGVSGEKDHEMTDIGVKEVVVASKVVTVEKPATETKAENIHLEDIDKKLDELLDSDIANV